MYLSVSKVYGSFNSELAKNEKNDCVVRSVASAASVSYNSAHKFCKEFFGRVDKRGTSSINIASQMLNAETKGIQIEGKEFAVRVLGKNEITNTYKLYGEIVKRKKTLKSFISSHKVGTYLVMIANHALTVKDGEVFDWSSNALKPTTKVVAAYELLEKENSGQLSLFD